MTVWIPVAAVTALGGAAAWGLSRSWKQPSRLTEAELLSRTAPGGPSAGARIARLPGGELLTYWEFGDSNGTPLLALHGMGTSGLMYSAHDALFRARGLRG